MPLACLYLPIVALAAVLGTRQAFILGSGAMLAFLFAATTPSRSRRDGCTVASPWR